MRSLTLSLIALVPFLVSPASGLTIDLNGREIPNVNQHNIRRAPASHVRRGGKCKARPGHSNGSIAQEGSNAIAAAKIDASSAVTSAAAEESSAPAPAAAASSSASGGEAQSSNAASASEAAPSAASSSGDASPASSSAAASSAPAEASSAAAAPSSATDSAQPPAATPPTGGGGGGDDPRGPGPWTGLATHFAAGQNNCGTHDDPNSSIVAVHKSLYNRWPGYDAQHDLSPVCGRKVSITWGGKTIEATVTDSCPTCQDENSLDLSKGAFAQFFNWNEEEIHKVGVMEGITWNWV